MPMPRALSSRASLRTSTVSTRCWTKKDVDDPQHGHQQGTDEGLGQDRRVGGQQAQEPAASGAARAPPARGGQRASGTTRSR